MASAAVLQHVLQEGREKQVMPYVRSVSLPVFADITGSVEELLLAAAAGERGGAAAGMGAGDARTAQPTWHARRRRQHQPGVLQAQDGAACLQGGDCMAQDCVSVHLNGWRSESAARHR